LWPAIQGDERPAEQIEFNGEGTTCRSSSWSQPQFEKTDGGDIELRRPR
jgi:hypothetical protein